MLRMPHVVSRHGRAPARPGREGRSGLQPAGRRQGISRGCRCHAGRRRGQQRRRSAQDQDRSRSARRCWSRSGDCAVTANVPGMRNPFGAKAVYDRAYRENVTFDPGIPDQVVPALLPSARPVHEVVNVDVFVPGCPPSPTDLITSSLVARRPSRNLLRRARSHRRLSAERRRFESRSSRCSGTLVKQENAS